MTAMQNARLSVIVCLLAVPANAQERVVLRAPDGGTVVADSYGTGRHGIILVHGGRYDRKSWTPQATVLASAGFRVVAIDLRGFGESQGPGQSDPYTAPLFNDVLGAVAFLRDHGCDTISAIGASMGAWAVAGASVAASGLIRSVAFLAATVSVAPDSIPGRKLFVVARLDTTAAGIPRLVKIREQYEQARDPKELLILDGFAHAQQIFETPDGARLLRKLQTFLRMP